MITELFDFITETETPEMADVLTSAHKALDRIGLVGSDERFRELLNTEELYEKGATIILIKRLTQDMLIELITQHGVIPDVEHADIETCTLLLNGILDLQDYEVATDITDCVQDGISTEEQFAQMLELVTPWHAETLVLCVESVSDAFIKRVCAFYKDQAYDGISLEQEAPTDVSDAAARLRRYIKFLENKQLLVMELIDGGLRVGFPLAIYLRTYGDDIAGMEPKRAAEELVALSIISADAQSTPQEAVREIIEDFISSLDQITRIDSAIRDIVLRFGRYEEA